MNNKFCAVPWNELYITSNGSYGMCCMEDQNSINDRMTLEYPVATHWNSDYMKQVRSDFIQGNNLSQCRQCWTEEENGKISGRMRRNQQYYGTPDIRIGDDIIKDTLLQTDTNGFTSTPIKGLFLNIGNLCQLRCAHCSPSWSRSILKDYKKLGWDINRNNRREMRPTDLVNDPKKHNEYLWSHIKEISPTVRWIRVSGGEPSISREFLDFLNWYAEQGYAKDATIFIATNAVNIKKEFIDALKSFRQVKLELSVDGVGAVDEYLRYPTNWAKKESNIDQLIKEFPESIIHTTVYSMNIGDLANLIKWAETKPVLHSIQCLYYPDYLSIQHLPDLYKEEIKNQLSRYSLSESYVLSDDYDRINYRNNAVAGVIGKLSLDRDPAKWAETQNTIKSYNTIRPKSLESIIPSLKKYLI